MVGATEAAQKIAGRRWRTLVDGKFPGALYPVNPRAREVLGYRAYPSLLDLPHPVDLAIIVVPTEAVTRVADECVRSAVGAVVVISGGFAESGAEGAAREAALAAQLRAAAIPMVGPNCAGMASAPANVNAMGWPLAPGRVGVISQSGNVALHLGYLAGVHGGGFSRIVTIGNACDLGVAELTRFLLDDPCTEAILLYVEGWDVGQGQTFLEVVGARAGAKPIILCNPGQTPTGRRAALSHTGALAASRRVIAGVCKQIGVQLVDDLEEAWLLACVLCGEPELSTNNVCVLTDGGGHATLVCDALDQQGVQSEPLSPMTQARLREQLPARCGMGNPIDFAGVAETEPSSLAPVLDICLDDPQVGAAVLVGHFGGYHRIGGAQLETEEVAAAEAICAAVAQHRKPTVVHSVYGDESPAALARLRDDGIPVTSSIHAVARVMRGIQEWTAINPRSGAALSNPVASPFATPAGNPVRSLVAVPPEKLKRFLAAAVEGVPRWLMEPEARALLQAYGLTFPASDVVYSEAQCAAACAKRACSTVLKLIVPTCLHKSDDGGVVLGITTPEEARAAHRRFAGMSENRPFRVLVTDVIEGGFETLFGALRDPQFGPCVLFGLGGTAAEALNDVTMRPAPVDRAQAQAMLGELRASVLFEGTRGTRPVDREAAVDLLIKLSEIIATAPEIEEIDLNPVFLSHAGVALADARVILTEP